MVYRLNLVVISFLNKILKYRIIFIYLNIVLVFVILYGKEIDKGYIVDKVKII